MNVGPEAKRLRQRAIRQLVASRPVTSQRELVDALGAQGFDVTQATVSRDIAELGLYKAPRAGAHVYVAPDDAPPAAPPAGGTPPSHACPPLQPRIARRCDKRGTPRTARPFANVVSLRVMRALCPPRGCS